MTATCQACTAPARDAFLCRACTAKLQHLLHDLPWWIDRLAEAAVGATRMSDGGGHGYQSRYPINGEHNVAHYLAIFTGDIDDLPDEKLLNKRYASARRQALAAGRVNDRASMLMGSINNTLTTILRDICESRGVPLRNVRAYPPGFIGALQNGAIRCEYRGRTQFAAQWLSEHVSAIAASEEAGQTYTEIRALVGDERRDGRIGQVVNRPIPFRDLGRCPTWNEDTRVVCGHPLRARADMLEVYCHVCRTTHKTDRLQLLLVNDLARAKVTTEEVLLLNRMLPEEYRINERMHQRWRANGILRPKGFLRPCTCGHSSGQHGRLRDEGCRKCECGHYDGREVITRHSEDDEILYAWADIRKLRAEQWKVPVA